MNSSRSSRVLGILGVVVAAALLSGNAALARGFRGPAPHGPGFGFHDRGAPYFYGSARWFLPLGGFVTVLPDFYSTFWFGGVPYYYADGTYYLWRPDMDGYVVTSPPAGAKPDAVSTNSGSLDVFAYPTKGQSDSQQATDRNECHDWAVSQAGGDPTRTAATAKHAKDAKDTASAAERDGYLRALTACLEGRGYSVK